MIPKLHSRGFVRWAVVSLTLTSQGRQGLTSDQVSLAELRQETEGKVGIRLTLKNRVFWWLPACSTILAPLRSSAFVGKSYSGFLDHDLPLHQQL